MDRRHAQSSEQLRRDGDMDDLLFTSPGPAASPSRRRPRRDNPSDDAEPSSFTPRFSIAVASPPTMMADALVVPPPIPLPPSQQQGGVTISADLLRLVVEAAPTGIVMVNAEGRIVLLNAQVERMFGYAKVELLHLPIEALIPERFRHGHVGHRASFFAAPTARAMGVGRELYGLRKDGSEFPIEIGLNPIATPEGHLVLSSIVDITERKRFEERFRLVVEAAPNGMVMINAQGQVVLLNAQVERMFGYERAELLHKPVELLIPERFRHSHVGHRTGFFVAPTTRPMGAGRELFGRRKDGSEFPIEIGLNPISAPEGLLVLSSIVDITERRALELLERRQAASQREAAETVARSRLLATMSHEIRTPLTGIVGCIDLLEAEATPSTDGGGPSQAGQSSRTSLVNTIRRCSDTLLSIINDILDFSKLDAGAVHVEHVVMQPRRVLEDVAAITSSQFRTKGIVLMTAIDDTVPTEVNGDPDRLRQVLLNLLSNAIKFTHAGGAVKISLSCQPSATMPSPLPGTHLFFEVRDTGVGIPPDVQARLFRPFVQADYSTTRKFGGTGLGLVISKMLVDLMHGDISLESEVGVGTCFRFHIRINEHDTVGASSGATPSQQPVSFHGDATHPGVAADVATHHVPMVDDQTKPSQQGDGGASACSVLLVDDDAIIQTVVVAMLRKLGCQPDVVGNGVEALVAVQAKGYHIVLMDCEMPVMDGFTATAELRRRGFGVPIIAMTANAMVGDRERCLAAGMDDYLSKPARLADLKSCLHRWCSFAFS